MIKQRGFTIVELLIVIVVIAILAAVAIVSYSAVQTRARDSDRSSDMMAVQKALELYYIDNRSFPYTEDLQNPTWRKANLTLQNEGAFINPLDTSSTNSINASGSVVSINKYSYYSTNSSAAVCSNASTNGPCTRYVLVWKLEANPTQNITKIVDYN